MIGGNTTAVLQVKTTAINEIGEKVSAWKDSAVLLGWLDYYSGEADTIEYSTKIQESSHIFITDYSIVPANLENIRFLIGNEVYQIVLIDNPLELNEHLEYYLRYIGRGL